MSSKFTDQIFKRVEPLWEAYLEHPFVKGIGEGTLDKEKFKHYLKQDYIYLIEYSRIFAIGASKSKDLKSMTMFADLLHGTMNYEMDLHRKYADQFGISKQELEAKKPSATMTAYTSYMLNKAQLGGVENATAAVLACAWSYNYIGKNLAKLPGAVDDEFYGHWVKTYSSEGFTKIANDCKDLLNELTAEKSVDELKELEEIVVKTSNFEYMFWEMAEKISDWPVSPRI